MVKHRNDFYKSVEPDRSSHVPTSQMPVAPLCSAHKAGTFCLEPASIRRGKSHAMKPVEILL
jgi:hypothetical protein